MGEMSPEEFERRLRACWARVRGVARRFAAGAEAEDLEQEIVVVAWARRSQLRDPEAFPRWLVRIALNRGRALFRRRPEIASCGLETAESHAADPADQAALADSVARALAALSEAERRTVLLRATELSTDEIARELSEAPGTTRARLTRARRKLAAELRTHGWRSLGRYPE